MKKLESNKYKWFEAIEKGNIDLLGKYLFHKIATIDDIDILGQNIAHHAMNYSNENLLDFALENNVMLDIKNTYGVKPYNLLDKTNLDLYIKVMNNYDDNYLFKVFTDYWYFDESKVSLYKNIIQDNICYKLNYLKKNRKVLYINLFDFYNEEDWFQEVLQNQNNPNSYILKNYDNLLEELTNSLVCNKLGEVKKI